MTISDAEQYFNEYETNVLDTFHTKYRLWREDRGLALFAILAQFDIGGTAEIGATPMIALSPFGFTQAIKGREEGLTQAARWLTDNGKQVEINICPPPKLIPTALEFAKYAKLYVDVADFTKMYRRGQIDIEVNPAKKQVRFVWSDDSKFGSPMLGIAEKALPQVSQGVEAAKDAVGLREDAEKALKACDPHFEQGCLVLQNYSRANLEVFINLQQAVKFADYEFFKPSTDLIGFTVGEFDQFFTGIRALSMAHSFLMIEKYQQEEAAFKKFQFTSTQRTKVSSFYDSISTLSGLPLSKVELITKRLTFDSRTGVPCIFQQPLFAVNEYVYWSPALMERTAYQRNMLRLMARTPALKAVADNIIGEREVGMLTKLQVALTGNNMCKCKLNTPIAFGADKTEVDLLAYNPNHPEQVLIVEGKSFLPVDEINEVDAATKEMMRGQKQIETIKQILTAMSPNDRARLFPFVEWNKVKTYFGLVVTPDTEPHQGLDHSVVPAISLLSLIENMQREHFACPQKLWSRAVNRPWLSDLKKYKSSTRQVFIGDVTYFIPIKYSDGDEPDQLQRRFYEALCPT